MRVRQLKAYRLHLPLRRPIRHASAVRTQSENLLIGCTLEDGTVGWGEGVPRNYVTGESVSGALQQLELSNIGQQLFQDCGSWEDVIHLCEHLEIFRPPGDSRGCYGNALRCALELSLLDAYGRLFEQSVSEVIARTASDLNLQKTQQQVRYSGVITAAAPGSELCSALKIRAYGFAQCKIKVGMPGVDDADRLTQLRRWLGSRMDLRLDANEAWKAEEVKSRLQSFLLHRISAIEQPVAHQDVDVLTEVRREFPIRLMLDESLTSSSDASMAIRKGTCDLFNIRLSKCGGIFNSLRLAAMARDAGLGYQLGCHPGESGILSAAGRHFATNVANLTYLEGSYDRHVLGRSLTKEDITFGYGGRAPALLGHGLGVVVKPDALRKMAVACQTYQLN